MLVLLLIAMLVVVVSVPTVRDKVKELLDRAIAAVKGVFSKD